MRTLRLMERRAKPDELQNGAEGLGIGRNMALTHNNAVWGEMVFSEGARK